MIARTYRDARRIHYIRRRRLRDAMGMRLRHVRTRPTGGAEYFLHTGLACRITRLVNLWNKDIVYPKGVLIFSSPDHPTYRAIVAHEGRRGGKTQLRLVYGASQYGCRLGRVGGAWVNCAGDTLDNTVIALYRANRIALGI